jgi:hypothetical protein
MVVKIVYFMLELGGNVNNTEDVYLVEGKKCSTNI